MVTTLAEKMLTNCNSPLPTGFQ